MDNDNKTRKQVKKEMNDKYIVAPITRKILRFSILLAIFLVIGGGIIGITKFKSYTKDLDSFDASKLNTAIPSKILDSDGKVIGEIGTETREELSIDDTPQLVKDALVSVEDRRFYQHKGIDLIRIGKATISAVIGKLKGSSGYSEGGSTLTQQLVKLGYLKDNNQTLSRKAQEAYISINLEKRYSKDEILQMYMNTVYMGNGIYGFATASKYYYNKDISELTLPQIAVISGMPNSPESFNPYASPELTKKRRDIVLSAMKETGKITTEEYNNAVKVDIMDGVVKKDDNKMGFKIDDKYNSIVTLVMKEAEEELGDKIYTDGYTIKTSINRGMQDFLDKLTHTTDYYDYKGDDDIISSVVIIDNKTGRLLAENGASRGMAYTNQGFDYATDIERQAGSSMKPILSYAPAVEYKGYTEDTYIIDEPYKYSDGTPVYNWDKSYKGSRTLKDQLAMSRNIPAIKLLKDVGLDKAYTFANTLGMDIPKDQYVESGAIGSISNASPLKMGQAYNSFANDGKYVKSHLITSIEDRDGIDIYDEPQPESVMSENTAYQVSDMLKAVVTSPEGTGGAVAVSGKDIRGKTGTTNYSDSELAQYNIPSSYSPDSWFVGFDEDYTVAVWTGYDSRANGLPPAWQSMGTEVAHEVFSNIK